jgi:hypothetical protein
LICEYNFWLRQQPKNEMPELNLIYKFDLLPIKTGYRQITMYNVGVPAQTDNSPCISANGENICTAIALGYNRCASNEFAFGTRLEVKGLGECIVTDRMNSRYTTAVDWAMPADQTKQALQFGRKNLLITVKD